MKHKLSSVTLAILSATALNVASAQETEKQVADDVEIIEVSGIRQSLTNALAEKRSADSLVEVIQAVDIGKMPDQNLAEVLENITGVQITREAGVGTGVQIRGTNANRTEINGVSTVGSGSGRTGISFEDVSASMISAVEVIKSPQAKTIEGSVGGTINLRTIRPLQLDDTLGSFRIQGEDSSLSTDGIKPRVSAAWGDNWELDSGGEFGVVLSASYAEQDVTAFRPRADRDNIVAADSGAASAQSFDFLPIQFLIQDYDNYESETMNFAGSLEWAPTSNTKFFFDAVVNDQDRRQESSRVQASGVSDLRNVSVPTEFEDVNFGVLDGQDLGSIKAALKGVIPVEDGGGDANLRFSSDTNSRQTDSQIFRLGGEWQGDDLLFSVEASTSRSNSTTPSFNTTLNFINPNVAVNDSNENGTPFEYDLSGGALAFGIAQSEANAPTSAQLLDPANVVLRDVNQGRDTTENQEDAFRADFTYYFDELIRSVDFGYRYNKSSSTSDQIRDNVGLRSMAESPTGDLFAELLVAGPDNFNAADGRSLFIKDFLLVNPELAGSNPDYVLDVLNDAIVANNAITGSDRAPISSPTSQVSAFFDIEETTHALYAQANFEYEMFRGNFGVRYLQTDITSTGNSVTIDSNGDQVVSQIVSEADYDFLLPRINIIADVAEDVIVRLGWSKDIRRPDYDDLSTSVSYSTSPNTAVAIGNPGLEPEEVTSFDISTEWYFAPSALVSVGYFHKKREDLHVTKQVDPYEDPATGYRDTAGPQCEDGGVFNPIADINVFGPEPGVGVCVPTQTTVNDSDTRTQQGIELAFQYDLSSFENDLGWASGFGVMANYTYQESSGGEAIDNAISRANAVFALTTGISDIEVSAKQPLIDLSENAYNFTLYYEKYGFSARARYTWREGYRSEDFGSTSSYPWGFPVVQEDRGQLNASVSYDVNDQLNIGVEAVNLTESEVSQSCVNGGSLLCYQGLTDRRITFGVSYRF
ncbi:MAG: iron complex outermembrane receptor protein [Pseudoalteromonas rhizosphaerae]|jgi:iron complex outermembrane receptor protein|uniref:TonB-dependent receptor n=1 Tax=Pseudoalteromonas neustonica TaxID=1840331 RepID=A0ABY3FCH9_9GAMM|nr:TonB-dependent receptor [Pseudoalteromonas neustonica]TVU82124.1 TonB-dependent receptor [Pseudoalteromonas neustonica]